MLDLFLLGAGAVTSDGNKGLNGIINGLVGNWIGPAYIILIAIVAVRFVKDRQFRELAAFGGIAAIVGLFLFFGNALFGTRGKVTKSVQDVANGINMAVPNEMFSANQYNKVK
jgi:hypothetical protein